MIKTKEEFVKTVLKHEDLEPFQTPFRITDDDKDYSKSKKRRMREWTSMYDDTIKVRLNPKAKKAPKRENFLYLERQEDLEPAVAEQFRRYHQANPNISVKEAVKIFDKSNPKGKMKFLQEHGLDPNTKLSEIINSDKIAEVEKEIKRQVNK
jgi:hypothetical protein